MNLSMVPCRTTIAAAAAVALVPVWWHLDLVDRGVSGFIAVFADVAVYPSDACLVVLAFSAVMRPAALGRSRWLVAGLALLAVVALLSAPRSIDAALTAGLAGHLALLTLAWLGVRSGHASPAGLVLALAGSAALQAVLACAQVVTQQALIPSGLQLPWLPFDASQAGTPVVLDASGDRLLRGFGTFPHPNVLGGYLAMALVCLPLLGRRWPRLVGVWWMLGLTITGGLLASLSRAGWLASAVGLGIWWSTRQRRVVAYCCLGVVCALAIGAAAASPFADVFAARVFPFGPGANALERGSVENRLALDRTAMVEVADHLPWGLGGGNYGLAAIADGSQEGWGEPPPNVGLLVAAELGVPGVVAVALVGVGTVILLRRNGRFDVVMTSACVALLVLGMLDHYTWTMPLGRVIAWAPFAMLAAAGWRSEPGRGGGASAEMCKMSASEPRGSCSMADAELSTPDWEQLGVGGALLTRYRQDQHALLEQLATFLEGTLPAQTEVRRTRGLLGPKHTTRLTVELNGLRYALERGQRDVLEARRTRVVRDVAVRTDSLPLADWLSELGTALNSELERTSVGRDALARLLQG